MNQQRILDQARRRYLNLGAGELTAAATFAAMTFWLIAPRLSTPTDVAALWSALLPLLAVLIQGGMYWLLARDWVGRARMPSGIARVYRVFTRINPVLLAAGLVGVIAWFPSSPLTAGLVLVAWAFGAVEYVNYFIVRLSYPLTSWTQEVHRRRRPRLVKDLLRA